MTFSTNIPFETWTASFAPLAGSSEFPLDRVIRVQAPDVGEIIRWVNDAGGVGPAGRDAHAPLNDGMLMVSAADPVPAPSACNRVIVMPAANADSVNVPLGQTDKPEPLAGILGTPLDIDILMAGSGTCERPIAGDHNLPTPVTLTFFYDEAQLNRAKISESQLRLIRFIRSPGQDTWSDARAISFDFDLNAISTELVTRDGIYAIGWVP
jgi:hypothetical protein